LVLAVLLLVNVAPLHVVDEMVGGPGVHVAMRLRMIVVVVLGGGGVAGTRLVGLIHLL
jgi:hypothetical protein